MYLDFDRPDAPLFFIAGEIDETIPPELNKKNSKAYKDEGSIDDYKEFSNSGHYICRQPGWEEVAAYVSDWLDSNVKSSL